LQNENKLKTGKYIFVAKADLLAKEHKELKNDFKYAIKKLNLFIK